MSGGTSGEDSTWITVNSGLGNSGSGSITGRNSLLTEPLEELTTSTRPS
ncbi:hypothetical protein [Streptomyces mirabilis]